MNTAGLIALTIGVAVVALVRGTCALRAEIAEIKSSFVSLIREIESHEWHVRTHEAPGKWREDMLQLLADAKKAMREAEAQTARVHLSRKARRRALELQRHAVERLRVYRSQQKTVEAWRIHLLDHPVDTMPQA